MKILAITCYKYPDYGRSVNLRAGLQAAPKIKTIVIKNHHRGIRRYPEILRKTIKAKRQHQPDAYLLTFRGYEILPAILLIARGKPVIFDELINPLEVVKEHRRQRQGTFIGWLMGSWNLLGWFYRLQVKRCRVILADSPAHAVYSAQLNHLPASKYSYVPVGANEKIFKPVKPVPTDAFQVLYVGSMVPLHGFEYLLQAAEKLKDQPDITFRIAGGGQKVAKQVAAAQTTGLNITHQAWLEPKLVPEAIAHANLCVGGPFGDTEQSQYVVTGKTYEILASAAPALVGQSPAISQAGFKNRVNCLTVPQADSQAIVDAILWAKNHPAELGKIRQAGRQLYEKSLGQEVINQSMVAVVAACL